MMLIRRTQPSDVEVIYQFLCELEEYKFDFQVFENLFLKNISHPNYIYLIAEERKEIVGFISCHAQNLLHHGGMVGEIQELFIPVTHRSKHIGKCLIEEIKKLAIEKNWINLEVTCNKKRVRTHHFYKREGFKETHLKFVKEIK